MKARWILSAAWLASGLLVGSIAPAAAATSDAESAPSASAATASQPSLPPDPYRIIGRAVLRTPPLAVGVSARSHDTPEPLGSLLDEANQDPGAALARLQDPEDPAAAAPGSELVAAVLELRVSARPDLGKAQLRLRAARDAAPFPALDAWVDLELGRAELLVGLFPEAAASARRALEAIEGRGYRGTLQEDGELLQAEALYLSGRPELARPFYRRLSFAREPAVRAAARLRRIDLAFDRGEAGDGYHEALTAVADHGIDVRPWWPRAAEAAIRAGQPSIAETWLTNFLEESPPSDLAALAELRLSDLLAMRGEVGPASERLEAIAAGNEGSPIAALADVRLAILELAAGEPDAATRLLGAAGASPHVPVAAYAHAVRGRAALERGRIDEAFRELARASRAGAANPQARETHADLERAVAAAVDASYQKGGCPRLVLRLAVRRAHLMEVLDEPGPFLRLGACFEKIGLDATAREVYRSIPRAFGPRVVGAVALPLARTSLATGESVATRTRALAQAVRPDSPSEWRLLLARSSLAAGEPGPAAEVLTRLVGSGDALGRDPRNLRLLARAALDGGSSPKSIDLLDRRIVALADGARAADAEPLADAALLTATARRRAGHRQRARALYAVAAEHLPQGWRLAEAEYWLARLDDGAGKLDAGRAIEPGGRPEVARMARLVAQARAVVRMRKLYGLSAPTSEPEATP